MAKKASKWDKYLNDILTILKNSPHKNPTDIAKEIGLMHGIRLDKRQLDLLRTYVLRVQKRNKRAAKAITSEVEQEKNNITFEKNEEKGEAVWSYDGTQSITSLEQAIAFSGVDTSKWEVERHIFNAWDITIKVNEEPIKRTNYQVKVWFRAKETVEIDRPKYRNITVKPKKHVQMWVIVGCVHRPFHDKLLWDKFIAFLKHNRKDITGILLNGDYLDLRSLSSHEIWIPDGIDLSYEYSDGLQGIQEIEGVLNPGIDKIFHYGNHEDRFFRDKISMRKYGRALPSPHEALELEERGWEVVTDWKNGFTTIGNDLDVFHGTRFGINAAKDQLQAIPNRNHIFAHSHRFGSHSNSTNTAYNIGCMVDIESDAFKYVDRGTRNSWAQGFAVSYVDEQGNTYTYPIKVAPDGSFFFKGAVY